MPLEEAPLLEVPQIGGEPARAEQVAKLVQLSKPLFKVQQLGGPLGAQNKQSLPLAHLTLSPLVQEGVPLVQAGVMPLEEELEEEIQPHFFI
jgi:hypothetical protein